jgi:hypothetical protein
MLSEGAKKKPSSAEYRERRTEFEEYKKSMICRNVLHQKALRMRHVNKVKLQLLYHL